MPPAAAPAVGACLGSPPLTVYVESAAGIREGARTGIASLMVSAGGQCSTGGRCACVVAACLLHVASHVWLQHLADTPHPSCQVSVFFFIALFFSPLLATVPPCEWGMRLV